MIEVSNLTKRFGKTVAVNRVSFSVAPGESACILGPSGSGKTTLLRLIAGLEVPAEGRILIDGEVMSDPGRLVEPRHRALGFVFQRPALWPHLTVAQNILFGLDGLPKQQRRFRLEELLESFLLVGMAKRFPHQLSSGQARLVSLARTLAPKPRHLLMDEPLVNLDSQRAEKVLDWIVDWRRRSDGSLIYITHNSKEGERVSEKILRMRQGTLLELPETAFSG